MNVTKQTYHHDSWYKNNRTEESKKDMVQQVKETNKFVLVLP